MNTIGLLVWMAIFWLVFFWSAFDPHDRLTWVLEALPALIGALVVLYFYLKRVPLTSILLICVLVHCVILIVGSHYTYALVPYFDQFMQGVWPQRNNYDKLGHYVQGFVPAIICRELVIRQGIFNSAAWRRFFVVCFCLAFSAFYELIEWWVALLSGEDAESFLGTQGYVWDTQSDMFLCLIGSVMALVLMSNWHDKQIKEIS
ncbi:DUF2238 domain-containing protein [Marinicella sp. S1101]|uniref:DUF2238 domain-containing protein n=1 Tax=Marinicella marina TaxID=2996016 RepID=UPI002260C7E1|nr:DUF2238 domain-containing protein [Marinicella marina]MCX7554601.1 DUF2238 domain-containing protein [Marinicella marina]MDJ1141015.1 DUF2238 domain-containing protein [Marinicella marina]